LGIDARHLRDVKARHAFIHIDERMDEIWSSWDGDHISIGHFRDGVKVEAPTFKRSIYVWDPHKRQIYVHEGVVDIDGLAADLKLVLDRMQPAYLKLKSSASKPLWQKKQPE
jgi:hypothetical protein